MSLLCAQAVLRSSSKLLWLSSFGPSLNCSKIFKRSCNANRHQRGLDFSTGRLDAYLPASYSIPPSTGVPSRDIRRISFRILKDGYCYPPFFRGSPRASWFLLLDGSRPGGTEECALVIGRGCRPRSSCGHPALPIGRGRDGRSGSRSRVAGHAQSSAQALSQPRSAPRCAGHGRVGEEAGPGDRSRSRSLANNLRIQNGGPARECAARGRKIRRESLETARTHTAASFAFCADGKSCGGMPGVGTIRKRQGTSRQSIAHGKTQTVACAAHWIEAFPLHGRSASAGALRLLERQPQTRSGSPR